MRITVISGGEAGAHFTRGLLEHLDSTPDLAGSEVTVIASTGDDISLWGLRLCPDLDLLVDTLAGVDAGAAGSDVVRAELAALGLEPQWYPVSDRALATHLARTAWLSRGETLTEVTTRLAERRGLSARGVRILPMSNVPVETHAVLDGPEDQQAVHVQQWRRDLGAPAATRFVVAGMDRAVAGPDVLEAIRGADLVLLPPSDPVLGLGIVLGVPGVRDALRGTSAPVVGVSPVTGSAPVPQALAASLATVGVEPTAAGVAGLYRDVLDGWLVDPSDGGARPTGGRWTLRTHSGPIDATDSADLAASALSLADSLRS
ncbi:2-phospho-L-lactate transferase CofD family protein [Janibacter sp. GS2]|uniref:2-phospho-L-lactate transferase CofD family protein n=1 Tax=Janibacter sp. GS2 TaxID=3442646 RepID=UPI003EBFB8CA